jgi:hypothetical protein
LGGITLRDSKQIHEITKLLALCWDENRELSFGEMIDNIFSFSKGHTQNEFWNMETKQCLIAIGDFREKKRLEREKYINDAD